MTEGFIDLQVNGYTGIDFNQNDLALVDMHKAVDLIARQVRSDGHDMLQFRLFGELVGCRHAFQGRSDDGVVDPIGYFFSKQVELGLEFFHTFDIFLLRFHLRYHLMLSL